MIRQWSNFQNLYKTSLIYCFDSISPKLFIVSHILLKFSIHSSWTSWKTTFLESMKHNSSNNSSDAILSSRPLTLPTVLIVYLLHCTLHPSVNETSVCSLPPRLWSVSLQNFPDSPISSAVSSSSATAAVGLEAELTAHNGYSEHQTLTVKGWS